MRPSFAFSHSPMPVGVIRERNVKDAIAYIKNSEAIGAKGFDLHLDALDEEFRTAEEIKKIVDATDFPILALTYNNGYFGPLDMNEDERTSLLMTAAEAGCSAVDLQGYSFETRAKTEFVDSEYASGDLEFLKDLMPREVTLNPEIVKKQKAFIDEVHKKGAEVLMSMHFGKHLKADQLKALARLGHDVKGADIIKLVTPCTTEEELADVLYSTVILKRDLGFPFSYHASGKKGYITRSICPALGSHIAFCNATYTGVSNPEQLPLKNTVDVFRSLNLM